MKNRLLNLIVCPACSGKLNISNVAQIQEEEIIEGNLICSACDKQYPISKGVPRLLLNFDSSDSREHERTASAFGWQWTHFTEMYDTFEMQFLDWIKPIPPEFFKDKIVMDAGCGIGRHTYYASQYDSKEVIGVDLSDAVDTAFENVGRRPNVHIIQADIMRLPFAPATFDFVYSIGVLHHLPMPKAGFNSLVPLVKPQGRIFAWVYGYENNGFIHHLVDPIRIRVTSRLPFFLLQSISFIITVVLQAMLKGIYRPLNRIGFKKLPYNDYFYQISGYGFRQNFTIVFDHLVAPIAYYLKEDDFRAWFTDQNLSNVIISWRNKNSWRGMADMP